MNHSSPSRPDLEALLDIALEAGRAIMAVYAGDFAVEIKPDASPLTEADLRAEAIILAHLSRLAPDIPVIAEEAVARGEIPDVGERFFLVDPLDGSKEFISRNGEFTVNIALVEDGRPILGVVHAPALDAIWWGGDGEGAFTARIEGGAIADRRVIACTPCSAEGVRVVTSRSHPGENEAEFLASHRVAGTEAIGSSLKFCLLAEGRADLYPRFGRTMEWDTAAGDAVLRAAGGSVETVDAVVLVYGKRGQAHDSDFANPHFIARGAS